MVIDCKKKVDQKELFVAIDHGLSFPEMTGLERPVELLQELISLPEVDGLIATPGLYRQAERNAITLGSLKRMITVDCVMEDRTGQLVQRKTVITPEDAASFRPYAYKMFLNIYEDQCKLMENIRDLSRFIAAGRRLGIATLAEIVFFGNKRFMNSSTQAGELFRGCRIAMELGADMLKVPLIGDVDALVEIIDRIKLPTYLLGGSASLSLDELLKQIAGLDCLPVRGLMFGRNLWRYNDMAERVRRISQCLKA